MNICSKTSQLLKYVTAYIDMYISYIDMHVSYYCRVHRNLANRS